MKNRKLSTAETDMFIKKYPVTSNRELAEFFEIDKKNVEYLGRKYRLKKSRKFLQESWVKGAKMRHLRRDKIWHNT